jgi:L,D-peptidoglycan transpeptidase YkuD (ErfK/YbiS/YcfS/YnhG family)
MTGPDEGSQIIEVRAAPAASIGVLRIAGREFACALGRSGIVVGKVEGDGGTPAGRFALREAFWRPDRGEAPETRLPAWPLSTADGWCDDPSDPAYNRRVPLPFPASHEALWREDHLYDLFAVIGFNDDPPSPGIGSAIFLHVVGEGLEGLAPTAGCVALAKSDLTAVLALCDSETLIDIDFG